jgi:hypothetical protein
VSRFQDTTELYNLDVLNSRVFQWGLVASLTILAILSRLKFNGLILDFDYGIYQPDGSHYAYRTLTFLGIDANLAANRIVDWYQIHGIKNNLFDVNLLSPENTGTWGLVAPRVLYSILSMPFVHFLGIPGMMVVPILSFITLIFAIFKVSELHKKQGVGLLLLIGLTTSPTVLRWMIANITDSLLTGLFAIVALILATNPSRKVWYLSIGTLILLTSSTRFCLPIWFAIGIFYLINKKRNQSIFIALVSSSAFIPTYLYMPSNAVLPANVDSSGIEKVIQLLFSFFKVGFIEVAQLAALDRALLIILVVALLLSLMNLNQMSSQIFILIIFSVWFIGAINGTLGVNFRYQLPVLAFACWAIIANLGQFPNWSVRRRINIVGKKT